MDEIENIKKSFTPQIEEVKKEFQILAKEIFTQFSDEFNYEIDLNLELSTDDDDLSAQLRMQFKKEDYDKIFQNLEIIYNHVRKEGLDIDYEIDLVDIYYRFVAETNQTIESFKKEYWKEIQTKDGIKKNFYVNKGKKTSANATIRAGEPNEIRTITISITDKINYDIDDED